MRLELGVGVQIHPQLQIALCGDETAEIMGFERRV